MRLRRETRRRMRRILAKNPGGSGLIIAGRFSLFRLSPTEYALAAVSVEVGRKRVASLHQMKRGPFWVPFRPGRKYHVRVIGLTDEPVVLELLLGDREKKMLYVEPARRGVPAVVKLTSL